MRLKNEKFIEEYIEWQLNASIEEKMMVEARLKRVLDEQAAQREAELREQEAFEQGREEGLQAARKAVQENTVRLLLEEGFDVKKIAELSELPEEQVAEIKEKMKKSEG